MFSCYECSAVFDNWKDIIKHLKKIHSIKEPVTKAIGTRRDMRKMTFREESSRKIRFEGLVHCKIQCNQVIVCITSNKQTKESNNN